MPGTLTADVRGCRILRLRCSAASAPPAIVGVRAPAMRRQRAPRGPLMGWPARIVERASSPLSDSQLVGVVGQGEDRSFPRGSAEPSDLAVGVKPAFGRRA